MSPAHPPSAPASAKQTRRLTQWRERYGPWALVTGASSGIGRAMAIQAAACGVDLVLVARRGDELERIAADMRSRHGVDVRVIPADLASPAGVEAVLSGTSDLDIGLVAAAAGFGSSGPFIDGSLEGELEMLEVNCRAVLILTHHFSRRLTSRGRGGIILMGSIVGFQGTPYAAHYSATKAYVQSLADALHVELAPHGVDVISSAPGPTSGGFAERANMRMSRTVSPETVAEATFAALGHRSTVLPGALTKVLTYALASLPRRARVRIMGRVLQDMTAHHGAG